MNNNLNPSREELEQMLAKAQADLQAQLEKMSPEERAAAQRKADQLIAEDQAAMQKLIDDAAGLTADSAPKAAPKFCGNCGAPVSGGAFCTYCGQALQNR